MGYHTDFSGEFEFDRPLAPEHAAYIRKFNETRRMARDPAIAEKMDDPVRIAAGLPLGPQAAYFVGGLGYLGQEMDSSTTNFNGAPEGQPGLWCQWTVTDDGAFLVWDEGEKFYKYVEWLEYLIEQFFKPWGYVLNGSVSYEGAELDDRGYIHVKDNRVQKVEDVITSPDPVWD